MSYTLTLRIDPKIVGQYNTQGRQLCFASGVSNGGKTYYNVVALSRALAQNVLIQWTDEYSIAASQDSFNNGVKFLASTDPVGIRPGQTYTLPANWTNGSVSPDQGAPQNGFGFANKANNAAAVLYRRINGAQNAIYFSQDAPLPPGKAQLTPTMKVAIWFATNAETGTMVSDFETPIQEVDLTGRSSASANCGADGSWILT